MEVHHLHFDSIDSTNSYAKKHAHEFDSQKLTCIFADEQTHGRGRFSRTWLSKKGNLTYSLFLPTALLPDSPSNLAQMSAMAALEVLHTKGIELSIKWPNDLVTKGKKLGGILVEMTEQGAVIGIGINVNAPIEADQPTISLLEISGKEWDIEELHNSITLQFQKELACGFQKERYESVLAFLGQPVQIREADHTYDGIIEGVTKQGHLELKRKDGSITVLRTGEIQQLRSK